ncbi:transcription factor WhiB [Stackebrandtia nassauensis DSM 44728]|uniref:Transcriptional regulator WhiB n=2 Tax=Stackebrandtia TaxID=283810 RepID=D3Q3W4_STANL|nr:transcription factor WhiB [Stackebrandtia nassauensis DSM 44728]
MTHYPRNQMTITTEREVTEVMTLGPGLREQAINKGRDLACREYDADLWFADTPTELEFAKSLCADCPVKVECLAGAMDRQEPWGVWGGEIFEAGAIVARKRPRGRPRKDAAEQEAAAQAALAERTKDVMATLEAA